MNSDNNPYSPPKSSYVQFGPCFLERIIIGNKQPHGAIRDQTLAAILILIMLSPALYLLIIKFEFDFIAYILIVVPMSFVAGILTCMIGAAFSTMRYNRHLRWDTALETIRQENNKWQY